MKESSSGINQGYKLQRTDVIDRIKSHALLANNNEQILGYLYKWWHHKSIQ